MNASIGIAVTVALAAGVALVQWTFAADFTRNIDWTQTAFILYIAATGTIGSLLVLPGLFADAQRRA